VENLIGKQSCRSQSIDGIMDLSSLSSREGGMDAGTTTPGCDI
jgi:hypothetical protein